MWFALPRTTRALTHRGVQTMHQDCNFDSPGDEQGVQPLRDDCDAATELATLESNAAAEGVPVNCFAASYHEMREGIRLDPMVTPGGQRAIVLLGGRYVEVARGERCQVSSTETPAGDVLRLLQASYRRPTPKGEGSQHRRFPEITERGNDEGCLVQLRFWHLPRDVPASPFPVTPSVRPEDGARQVESGKQSVLWHVPQGGTLTVTFGDGRQRLFSWDGQMARYTEVRSVTEYLASDEVERMRQQKRIERLRQQTGGGRRNGGDQFAALAADAIRVPLRVKRAAALVCGPADDSDELSTE